MVINIEALASANSDLPRRLSGRQLAARLKLRLIRFSCLCKLNAMHPECTSRKYLSSSLSHNHMLLAHQHYNTANRIVGTELVTFLIRAACVLSATILLLVAYGKAQERDNRISPLIQQLRSSDANIRRQAIDELERIGPTAVRELINISRSRDEEAVNLAVNALVEMGPKAVPTLIDALEGRDSGVRASSAFILGKIGPYSKEAAPILIGLLNDSEVEIRGSAVFALGRIAANANNVVPALLTLFHSEPNTEIRYAIVEALSNIGSKEAVPTLIDLLNDNDTNMRGSAVFALGRIGANAENVVPALLTLLHKEPEIEVRYAILEALGQFGGKAKVALPILVPMFQHVNADLRLAVAEALFKIGPDTKEMIPIWVTTLNEENPQLNTFAINALIKAGPSIVPELTKILVEDKNAKSRNNAASILKQFGPAAKDAVPTLISALVDNNHKLNGPIATVLGEIGPDAREAVPVLISALKAKSLADRSAAAFALGGIRADAKGAVPALIEALDDPSETVRQMAAQAIGKIAIGIFDTKSTEMLPQMKRAHELMRNHSDQNVKNNAAWVKRTVDYFESIWWIKARERTVNTVKDHPNVTFAIAAYLSLQFTWLLLFWLRPLSLLRVTMSLSMVGEKVKIPIIDIPVPIKTALVFPALHYHTRLLDAWIRHYLVIARDNFATKRTVVKRIVYVPMPIMVNGTVCGSLSATILQPLFDRRKVALLIAGEGGAGKTSLACQMATWAMADEPAQRLCKTHRLLPVLVEANLDQRNDNRDVLLESIRGGLREMIDETEPIFEELFLQLLRKRRVLVIVDSLSELNESSRKCVRPAQADFPIATLIVTSRIDEYLGGASKTMLRPQRLKRDRLSTFMDHYLEQLGKRDLFNDEEYFDSCRRLSQLVGDREITVLIAKMYAEAMIAAKESDVNAQGVTSELPRNLPDLMLGYVKQLNDQVQADKQDISKVARGAKVVAWECLKQTCSPTMPKRSDVLLGLINEMDAETLLKYLEERLQLIQTTGPVSDLIRFSLDPLAEYLAALYLIERCGNRGDLWKDFFKRAQEQQNAPEAIKGFLLAVRDCCEAKRNEFLVPNWVDDELARLSDVDVAFLDSSRTCKFRSYSC